MASNIRFDFKDIHPDLDTVRDLAYKSDYNFEQIIMALNLFSYRGVEIGPDEPEDKECLWIDTKDEEVEDDTHEDVSIIRDVLEAISALQDRMTSIEQAIASGGGISDDEEITAQHMVLEDGTVFITELGVPFMLES